ncbi:MAG: hypothetical protein K5697_10505 [Lachnospiraceae bacterium]|nr:hypothetical protein [Lachnospiraceae bacterium]
MTVEMIEGGNLRDYMHLLTNEEIYGIDSGRYTAIGVFDEDGRRPMGFALLEVLPAYVSLRRLFVAGRCDKRRISEELLDVVRHMPKEDKLPVLFFVSGNGGEELRLVQKNGFARDESDYSCKEAYLSGLKDIFLTKEEEDSILVDSVSDVPDEELYPFVFNSPHDPILQIPWYDIDRDRFADGIVCKKNGRVTAVLLLEENDDYVEIPWFYGTDMLSLNVCISRLKDIFMHEAEGDVKFRFLSVAGIKSSAPDGYFEEITEQPVQIYKML